MKTYLLVAIACVFTIDLHAQQDPLYAQYFNNPMLINPAFAGSHERLFVGLGYRSQWSGVEGGPTTFNFNSHMSIVDNKVGAGIILVEDKLGETRTAQYGSAFSYRIKLTGATLSFGMQFGAVRYETNLKGVQVLNPDPLFAPFTSTKFNTGAGVLLKSDRYSLGLSVPHLLPNTMHQGNEAERISGQNYYLFASYLFNLSERVELKPSTLLRMTKGTPVSVDLNLNVTFNRLYTAGLFARNLNTYGLLMQIGVKNLRFGYVFELPGKNSALNFNTHEISLALSLEVLKFHDHSMIGF